MKNYFLRQIGQNERKKSSIRSCIKVSRKYRLRMHLLINWLNKRKYLKKKGNKKIKTKLKNVEEKLTNKTAEDPSNIIRIKAN